MNFTITQGESITEFYIHAINIQSQLILLQYKTGQKNKLVDKLLISLNLQNNISIKAALQTYVLKWNKFCKLPNNILHHTYSASLKDIFDNIRFSGVSPHTILTPVMAPTATPTTLSAAYSNIPIPILNHFNSQKPHHRQQQPFCHQQKSQKTYNHDFQGCNLCKLDAEDMVNVARQLFTHKDDDCPLTGPQNIRTKNTQKVLTQHIAKNPPPKTKPELDMKQKIPICPMLSRKPLVKKMAFKLPSEDQDEEGCATAHEDEPTPTEDNIDDNNDTEDDNDINNSEEYNTDLNYLPLPSFNSMDVSQSAAHTYEDFYNYQA
eukprot:15063729-Ditylum_brightwellii.AAC.1